MAPDRIADSCRRAPRSGGGKRQGRRGQIDRRGERRTGDAAAGWRIGLMDADVYGPSVAMMVGRNIESSSRPNAASSRWKVLVSLHLDGFVR